MLLPESTKDNPLLRKVVQKQVLARVPEAKSIQITEVLQAKGTMSFLVTAQYDSGDKIGLQLDWNDIAVEQ